MAATPHALKNPGMMKFLATFLAMGRFYQGFCISIFNPLAGPLLTNVLGIDKTAHPEMYDYYNGAFFAVFSIGAMVGVFSVGALSNRYGRVPIMFFGEVLALGNSFLYLVQDVRVIIGARFISGVISGINTIAGIVLSELLGKSVGGVGNAFGYFFSTSATFTGFVTQNILSKQQMIDHYRELLMATTIISFMRICVLSPLVKTDTPKFLYLSSPFKEEAQYLIRKCYSNIYKEEEVESITQDAMETFKMQGETNKVSVKALFSSNFRLRLFSGCFLAFGQQCCGINFMIFFSTKVFDEISGNGKTITLIVGISNMVGAALSMYLIGRCGRKFDIVWGCFLQTICLFGLLVGVEYKLDWLMAITTAGYILGFAAGFGGTYMAYLTEILPPSGVGIAMSLQWILTAAIGQFTPRLSTIFGPKAVLLGFAITCFLLFLGTSIFLIETKGKSEQEVIKQFEEGNLKFFDFR